MKRLVKLGLSAYILAAALLLAGCGAHAGFNIGKKSTPAQTYASAAQPGNVH